MTLTLTAAGQPGHTTVALTAEGQPGETTGTVYENCVFRVPD